MSINLLEFIHLNVVYALNHRNRALGKNDIRFSKAEVLERAVFGQVGVITDKEGNIYHKNYLVFGQQLRKRR